MEKCSRCNINEPHDEFDLCEPCMNQMLMGGGSHVFVPYETFFKEIGIDPTESPSDSGSRKGSGGSYE